MTEMQQVVDDKKWLLESAKQLTTFTPSLLEDMTATNESSIRHPILYIDFETLSKMFDMQEATVVDEEGN